MTPNIEEMLESLKKCSLKIDSLNDEIQNLSCFNQDLFKTVKLSKEYNDSLKSLPEYQTRVLLVKALEDEIKTVKNLETENKELLAAIQHHQQVLSVIIEKYHEHCTKLDKLNHLEEAYEIQDDIIHDRYRHFMEKCQEIFPLVDSACVFDETEIANQKKLIEKILDYNNRIKQCFNSQIIAANMNDEKDSKNGEQQTEMPIAPS